MKGTIKAYSPIVDAGVIQCEAGRVYIFRRENWQNDRLPVSEQTVRFEAQDRKAIKVLSEE